MSKSSKSTPILDVPKAIKVSGCYRIARYALHAFQIEKFDPTNSAYTKVGEANTFPIIASNLSEILINELIEF